MQVHSRDASSWISLLEWPQQFSVSWITEIDFVIVLESGSLKLRDSRVVFFWGLSLQLAAGRQSCPHRVFLSMWLCSNHILSYEHQSHWVWALGWECRSVVECLPITCKRPWASITSTTQKLKNNNVAYQLVSTPGLFITVKTLSPNVITFWSSRIRTDMCGCGQRHHSPEPARCGSQLCFIFAEFPYAFAVLAKSILTQRLFSAWHDKNVLLRKPA